MSEPSSRGRGATLAARALLDLALPASCAGCGADATNLCARCAASLAGRPRLAWPDPRPPGLPPPWAAARYADVVRELIVAHKEHGARALAGPLGTALAASVVAARRGLTGDQRARRLVLVPMPSRREAVRARGHDPTLTMARRAGRLLRRVGSPAAVCPVLRLRPGVTDQAGLDAAARAANLSGAVRLARGAARLLDGATVLLLDDVVTTGSSLAAAAAALRARGVDVPAAALVAATARRAAGPGTGGAAGAR